MSELQTKRRSADHYEEADVDAKDVKQSDSSDDETDGANNLRYKSKTKKNQNKYAANGAVVANMAPDFRGQYKNNRHRFNSDGQYVGSLYDADFETQVAGTFVPVSELTTYKFHDMYSTKTVEVAGKTLQCAISSNQKNSKQCPAGFGCKESLLCPYQHKRGFVQNQATLRANQMKMSRATARAATVASC